MSLTKIDFAKPASVSAWRPVVVCKWCSLTCFGVVGVMALVTYCLGGFG